CLLLDDVTTEPGRVLARGPVATTGELATARRHAAARPPAREPGEVVSPILAAAQRRPEAVAVSDDHGDVTFGELAARSGWVADELIRRGVTRGDAVGVCLPRGGDWLTVLLGVWRAGAVYVPLDRSYPAARLTAMIEDRGPALVVGRAGAPPSDGWPTAAPRWEFDTLAGRAGGDHTVRPLPAEPAYTIYTSGSTGRPKGVQISHRALANTVGAALDVFGHTENDCCSQLSNAGFDASLWEALPALVAGGRVAVFSDRERVDTTGLWDALAVRGVTISLLTTSVLGAAQATAPAGHASLRCLQTGGDRLAAVPLGLPTVLWNVYGPTEAAIAATAGVVHPGGEVHIGGPLPGTRAYVLDPWLRPVPAGVPGELFLAGAGIALGYHGAGGHTAQRFLPDVVAGDGSRMYRTGDLVRRGPGGDLTYLRRVDRQVKVRGQRIELGEIESALVALPGVVTAVVTVRDGVLVAHYVAGADARPDEADLRRQLGLRLPEAMVPVRYVRLDSLPMTANGKVDQTALPEPPAAGHDTAVVPLTGPIQEIIAEVWQEVLPVTTVSAGDNFFALGGHSLLATRVATRLSDRLGLQVPLTQIFELPVLSHLADAVEERVVAQMRAEQA
ncbi:non-ribosomal peptide synthetase, partial [Actinoplanes philippinensis]|uniref:non-ribosomal peptide synthetase n=1 Tax=Actinoplanes philippinensis TaxID=35752 RepID=UPI0033E2D476